jgi:hypothetical protein
MPNLGIVRTHWVAWTIVGLTVAADAAAIGFAILDRGVQSSVATVMFTVVTIGFASLGALIVSQERANAIGWLFVGVALLMAFPHNLFQNYAVYALFVAPGSVPLGSAAFWLSSSVFDGVFVMFMTLLLLLFPDGRPLTPRWRIAVGCAVLAAAMTLAQGFIVSNGEPPLDHIAHPLGVSGTGGTVLTAIRNLSVIPALIAFGAGVTSMVLRFRRSAGIERQQMKAVVAGAVFVAALFTLSLVLAGVGVADLSGVTFVVALALFPTLMGVAILRYRLYDIDVVIRKTLLYACLIATLALLYLGGIAGLGAVFRSATGASGALAVTLSTLAVAVAFQPLRSRIQRAIDRRFSRRAYDAEAAVRVFTGRLREEIDLDVLGRELVGVVDETVQPRHASLWLRPPEKTA